MKTDFLRAYKVFPWWVFVEVATDIGIVGIGEVRSLTRERLKIRPEGGEKINRPLAGTKEGF